MAVYKLPRPKPIGRRRMGGPTAVPGQSPGGGYTPLHANQRQAQRYYNYVTQLSHDPALRRSKVPAPAKAKPKVPARAPGLGRDTVAQPFTPGTAAGINTQPGAFSGGTGSYDVSSDPAVQAARGLAGKIRAQANATAAAKRKQAAIEYGSGEGVTGLDQATIDAARNNPYSILQNMRHAYDTGLQGLEGDLNKANLFYSGYRGQQLGEAARAYAENQSKAATNFQGLQTDINDMLAQALLSADEMDMQALLGSEGGYYDPYSGDYGGYGGVGGSLIAGLRQAVGPSNWFSGTQLNRGRPTRPAPKPKPKRYKPVAYRRMGP